MSDFKSVIVVFGLFLSLSAKAGASPEKLEQEVLASFHSPVGASKKLDTEAYFKHFDSHKFVGLNSDGTNWNSIHELVPTINTGFSSIKEVISLKFLNVKVSIIDNYTASW